MIGGAMVTTIKTLWEKYKNKTKIAKLTGHDWKTVAKAIKLMESGQEYPKKKPHQRILDLHKEEILEWLGEGLTGVRIFEKLKDKGIKAGRSTVADYISLIKKNQKIFVRIHTKAGEEAQVDFGYVGLTATKTGKRRKTWIFNMKLSYSRLDYYEKVYNQRVETFIQCHVNGFRYFGGVPEYVKIDNLKAAILEANFYQPVYQQLYKTFAEYYNFKPIPCRIYRPNDKGKVESGIKYVKGNFFLGRKFQDEYDLDWQLKQWQEHKCNIRIHGTTRKVPREVFEQEEKIKLKELPIVEFKMPQVGTRSVYHDCHIYVDYNYYSVPFEFVGKDVDIELTNKLLKVSYNNKEIAIHARAEGKGNFITNGNHYPKYKMMSSTEYQEKYQVKMKEVGPYAEQLFFIVLENHKNDWSRPVQGILSLVKTYGVDIVNKSCKRAIAFGVHDYQMIKNICSKGTYNLPLEFNYSETLLNNNQEVLYEYA